MTQELILTRGVQASGKSTGALKWVDADPKNRVRVNRDEIRHTLFNSWWGETVDENLVTVVEENAIRAALKAGRSVIVDATHLNAKQAKQKLKIGHEFEAKVSFMDFPVTYDLAVVRDKFRKAKGDRYVGEKVINDYFTRYHINKETGKLPPQPVVDNPVSHVWPSYKPLEKYRPRAIIVDVDGTLANIDHRGPYDSSKYAEDGFNWVIAKVAIAYAKANAGVKIIVVSGRDEKFRKVTQDWMNKYAFPWDFFYMRPEGDTRNDAVVKNELFEKYVAGRYSVDFCLDDRKRVSDMWRAKGLLVLQVAEGDY